uniref:Uncharacterized protein MANES_16G083500 n=1 Tax=Rhizophora mucronata TaxID=61149 RepID=A0A2P2KU42_RHIMU
MLQVCSILLDPSCSGSGTAAQRLDHLLPSYAPASDVADNERLNKLATFQKKALAHALSFPAVERVVYSTCSVNQIENEDVINSVLPLAASFGFELMTPFPRWQRRGLPVFEGSARVLRTDPVEDKEGFFIALFVRKVINGRGDIAEVGKVPDKPYFKKRSHGNKRKTAMPLLHHRISKMWLHGTSILRRRISHQPSIRHN